MMGIERHVARARFEDRKQRDRKLLRPLHADGDGPVRAGADGLKMLRPQVLEET